MHIRGSEERGQTIVHVGSVEVGSEGTLSMGKTGCPRFDRVCQVALPTETNYSATFIDCHTIPGVLNVVELINGMFCKRDSVVRTEVQASWGMERTKKVNVAIRYVPTEGTDHVLVTPEAPITKIAMHLLQ